MNRALNIPRAFGSTRGRVKQYPGRLRSPSLNDATPSRLMIHFRTHPGQLVPRNLGLDAAIPGIETEFAAMNE